MTTAAKTWVTIIVIIILGVLAWMWHSHSAAMPEYAPANSMDESAMPQGGAAGDTAPAMSSNSDSSDSGIDQDMTSVNAQMNAMDSDSANAQQDY